MFDTETGVSTLLLKEIPYRHVAYIRVQSAQPEGLAEHIAECVSFCRLCGAETVYASGNADLTPWPVHCRVVPMAMYYVDDGDPGANLFPVTAETAARWREIYNERMAGVDNAATLTAYDEKELLSTGGAYFVHEAGKLLGIGWIVGSEVRCVASVVAGAGERVMRTLLTLSETDRVTLEVASTNTRAIRLYERLGFLPTGEGRSFHTVFKGGNRL